MNTHETEQPNNSPSLSPEVVQRFANACANIYAYGEFVRSKRIVLNELEVADDELKIKHGDRMEATHQTSGKMHTSPFAPSIYQVELWMPLETVMPRKVVLMGQEVTLKTVMRDGCMSNDSSYQLGGTRSVISTAEDQIFVIDSDERTPYPSSIQEYTSDTQVEFENKILAALAYDLDEGYPEVAKQFPKK